MALEITLDELKSNATKTEQLARWVYRLYLVEYYVSMDHKKMASIWGSLRDGCGKWPLLASIAKGFEEPRAFNQYVKTTLAPAIKEENRRNYDGLLRLAGIQTPTEKRDKAQNDRILDLLIDQVLYYWLAATTREDDIFSGAIRSPEFAREVIAEFRGTHEPQQVKADRAYIKGLWNFIETEALRGRQWKKTLWDEKTSAAILTARSKNGTALATGGGEIETSAGAVMLDYGFDFLPMNAQTAKAYWWYCMALTENITHLAPGQEPKAADIERASTIKKTVKEYAQFRGLSDLKQARNELRAVTNTLLVAKVNIDGVWYVVGGKLKGLDDEPPADSYTRLEDMPDPIRDGVVEFTFNYYLAVKLAAKSLPRFHYGLGQTDGRKNPHSFNIGIKICNHHNMNILKPNANRISVKALLAACPDIPQYENVKNRRYKQLIMDPFERDLMALKDKYGVLASWHYCGPNGADLTAEQVTNYAYKDWITWNVEFRLVDFPEDELIEVKQDVVKKAAAAKKKRNYSRKKKAEQG